MSAKPASKYPHYDRIQAHHCGLGDIPKSDDGYFEKMIMIIFRSGLNWSVIEKKWPNFVEAFVNFSVDKVAEFDVPDIDRLMEDQGIVRNYRKIESTVKNAREFQAIKKEFGSFGAYLDSVSKEGEEELCKQISKRFAHMGKSTSMMFLKSVGLEMPEMTRYWMEKQRMV